MSNTLAGTLVNNQLATNAVPTGAGFVCPLNNIGTRVSVAYARTGTIEVPFITATSATASNPDTFQSGDSTLAKVSVTFAHLAKRSHVAAPDGNRGLMTTNHILESLKRDFEKDVFGLAMTQIQAAAFGAADMTSAAADFDITDLEALALTCTTGNPRTALLASAAIPGCANDLVRDGGKWVYPLIDGGVYEATLTGSVADVAIIAGPTALAWAMERPEHWSTLPASEFRVTEIVLPRLQIPAWVCQWYDRGTRAWWLSVEGIFGCGPAEPAALSYAVSA